MLNLKSLLRKQAPVLHGCASACQRLLPRNLLFAVCNPASGPERQCIKQRLDGVFCNAQARTPAQQLPRRGQSCGRTWMPSCSAAILMPTPRWLLS